MAESMRSQGAGGQNVNKTASAVRLRWSLRQSLTLDDEERYFLLEKFQAILTTEGELLVRSEESRDQLTNKKNCYKKMEALFLKALFVPKKRVATKPTRSSQRKRLESKKVHSEKKQRRSKAGID